MFWVLELAKESCCPRSNDSEELFILSSFKICSYKVKIQEVKISKVMQVFSCRKAALGLKELTDYYMDAFIFKDINFHGFCISATPLRLNSLFLV